MLFRSGVELDLLEPHHPRDDVDFPVRPSRILWIGWDGECRSGVVPVVPGLSVLRVRLAGREPAQVGHRFRPTIGLRPSACRERVENRDPAVRNRVRVVVALDRPDERLPAVEVEAFDLERPSFEQIDRLRMQRRWTAREIRFANDLDRKSTRLNSSH